MISSINSYCCFYFVQLSKYSSRGSKKFVQQFMEAEVTVNGVCSDGSHLSEQI